MKQGYLVKIVPPKGYRVHRFEFTPWQFAGTALLAFVLVAAIVVYGAFAVRTAEARVNALGRVTNSQQDQLTQMDHRAEALGDELQRLQTENQQIRRLMGVRSAPAKTSGAAPRLAPAIDDAPAQQHAMLSGSGSDGNFQQVSERLGRLEAESARAQRDGDGLRQLAMRVLNVRKLEELAQARVIAAIPSINPVEGTSIASAFGWRLDPWPSFHEGVDLDANYGDEVRAAAAGTVASVGWDGGYGLKVDIDHGNGYHTWYAHLSRASVQAGDYVRKAQPIAYVGQTGDATGPHLHYQVMFGGHAIDPTPFLNGVPEKVLASLK